MMNSLLSSILLVPVFLVLIMPIIIAKGQSNIVETFDNNVETEILEDKLDNFVYNLDYGFTESKVSESVFAKFIFSMYTLF